MEPKPFISHMSTVLTLPLNGVDIRERKHLDHFDRKVLLKIEGIINSLKKKHEKFKDPDFGPTASDELGARCLYNSSIPNPVASFKYPPPDALTWARPCYSDLEKFRDLHINVDDDEDDESSSRPKNEPIKSFCKNGMLFDVDGGTNGDIIQGQLGDCWFLGALAIFAGANSVGKNNRQQLEILKRTFFMQDKFKEYGIYAARFFKDGNLIYVIIDDRLPVRRKDGQLVFGSSKNVNELWVAFLEKAYAKLFGCYKSLIGGYVHQALGDLTGLCPIHTVMKRGHIGYAKDYTQDDIWNILTKYREWKSLMGCSIQSNPKQTVKVETDAGNGLFYGHTYVLNTIGEIEVHPDDESSFNELLISETLPALDSRDDDVVPVRRKIRLVQMRNPWGRGEWEGAFNDKWILENLKKNDYFYAKQFNDVFGVDFLDDTKDSHEIENDGHFYIPFVTWCKKFTSLYSALIFPSSWSFRSMSGKWSGDLGGNRDQETWISNPQIKFRLTPKANAASSSSSSPMAKSKKNDFVNIFIRLNTTDCRMTLGSEYFKDPLYSIPLSFDIVNEKQLMNNKESRDFIYPAKRSNVFGETSLEDSEDGNDEGGGDISPAKRNGNVSPFKLKPKNKVQQPSYNYGATQIFVQLQCNRDYYLVPFLYNRGHTGFYQFSIYAENADIEISESTSSADIFKPRINPNDKDQSVSKTSIVQYYERKENLRERIIHEMKRLNMNIAQWFSLFNDTNDLTNREFKRRMVDAGFNLSDMPDDDVAIVDSDSTDGKINLGEVKNFLQVGKDIMDRLNIPPPPPPPIDDLLHKCVNIDGILAVNVIKATALRDTTSWFSEKSDNNCDDQGTSNLRRKLIDYDPKKSADYFEWKKKGGKYPNLLSIETPFGNLNNSANQASQLSPIDIPDQVSPLGSPLKTPYSIGGGGASPWPNDDKIIDDDNYGDESTMMNNDNRTTVSKSAIISKSNSQAAGLKLHTDPFLRAAESKRTDNLMELKLAKQNELQNSRRKIEELDAQTILKKSNKALRNKNSKKRLVIKNDPYTMRWLNLGPGKELSHNDELGALGTMVPGVRAAEAIDRSSERSGTSAARRVPLNRDLDNDIWDIIIDQVITITLSRQSFFHSEINSITNSALSNSKLDNSRSVPVPVLSRQGLESRGSKIPSRSHKSQMAPNNNKDMNELLAKKLQEHETEQKYSWEQVYQRLILIPITNLNDLEGNREFSESSTRNQDNAVRSIFEMIDKNGNGYISIDEFKQALEDANIRVTSEDCKVLFTRFQLDKHDSVDYIEFINFYDTFIVKNLVRDVVEKDVTERSIEEALTDLRIKLRSLIKQMEMKNVLSPDDLTTASVNRRGSEEKWYLSNESFLTQLTYELAPSNTKRLNSFGIGIDVPEMRRISRIFCNSVHKLMNFVTSSDAAFDLSKAIQEANLKVMECLLERSEKSTGSMDMSMSSVSKLWSTISATTEVGVDYEVLYQFFWRAVEDSAQIEVNESNSSVGLLVMGVQMQHILRVLIDEIMYSTWNRSLYYTDKLKLETCLTFSGFEAYLRYSHINILERKLKFMFHFMNNNKYGHVYTFVHVYINHGTNEVLVLSYDPLNGIVSKLKVSENISNLPTKRNKNNFQGPEGINLALYNPWETPVEDAAISALVSRLRLVRNSTNKITLFIAEDPKFVQHLSGLLGACRTVPFFSVLNELTLTFDVDIDKIKEKGKETLEKLIFGSIRRKKPLYSFLTNSMSSIRVVLSSYNSGIRKSLLWSEMLSYLSNYQNPFVCVQLLPVPLETKDYMFLNSKPACEMFNGDESKDNVIQRGQVNIDGGKYPIWNSHFNVNYRPPAMLSCKIVLTEVAKIVFEDKERIVLVMARESKSTNEKNSEKNEFFYFLTIYDPRSSTDYMCGCPKDSALYCKSLKDGNFETLKKNLQEAIENNEIFVGPAITPRMLVSVYNQRGNTEELVGTCQISISSILSGTGLAKPQWSKLVYSSIDAKTGRTHSIYAGEIMVDLSFRKKIEIDAEVASNKKIRDLKSHKKIQGVSKMIGLHYSTSTKHLHGSNSKTSDLFDDELDAQTSNDALKLEDLKKQLDEKESELSKMLKNRDELKDLVKDLEKANNSTIEEETINPGNLKSESKKDSNSSRVDDEALASQLSSLREKFKAHGLDDINDELLESQQELVIKEKARLRDNINILRDSCAKLEEELKQKASHPVTINSSNNLNKEENTYGLGKEATSAINEVSFHVPELFVPDNTSYITLWCSIYTYLKSKNKDASKVSKLLTCYHGKDQCLGAGDICNAFADIGIEFSLDNSSQLLETLLSSSEPLTHSARAPVTDVTSFVDSLFAHNGAPVLKGRFISTVKTSIVRESLNNIDIKNSSSSSSNSSSIPSDFTSKKKGASNKKSVELDSIDDLDDIHIISKDDEELPKGNTFVDHSNHVKSTAAHDEISSQLFGTGNDITPEVVDWDTLKVPPKWERRFDEKKKKHYYANHDQKITQWNHPSNESGVKSSRAND